MNIQKMMKEAQKMQERLQEQLAELRVEGTAGGGAVSATLDGHRNLLSLKISPDVIVPDDAEMLQDLIVAAVADAGRKVEEETRDAMGGMMGGLGIPGLT